MLDFIKNNIKLIVVALGCIIVICLLLNKDKIEEAFASDFWHRGKMEDIRNNIEEKSQEDFEPNNYVISEYSHFELDAEQKDMLEDPSMELLTDVKHLEDQNFLQPVTFYDQYATVDQVKPNDAGSGDIQDMNSAFENADKDQFYENIKMISSRGGNTL